MTDFETVVGPLPRDRRRSISPVRRSAAVLVFFAMGAGAVAGCSDDGGSRAVDFCTTIDENVDDLTKPRLRDQDDVDAFVALYREIGDKAPIAISDDWDILTNAYATAGTAEPNNPESMNDARRAIFAAERSALRVKRWLQRTCDVNLGPVTTIVDHSVKVPVSTTTPAPEG